MVVPKPRDESVHERFVFIEPAHAWDRWRACRGEATAFEVE